MPKTFYSLGYNQANELDVQVQLLKINDHEYRPDDLNHELFNISSWWTPSMSTNLVCKFLVKMKEVRSDCCLGKSDEIFLTLYSYCPGTKLQHHGTPILVGDVEEVEASLEIPPTEIAEYINLYAVLTARFDETTSRAVGAPVLSNSRLLTKTWKIYLSGSNTQANVICLDFAKDQARAKSMWQIKINDTTDLDSWITTQHSNVLRIEVNKLYEDYIQQSTFQVLMMTDLVMLALDKAINDEEKLMFLQNDSMAEGSWARFVKSMYQNIFSVGQIGVKQRWREEQDSIRSRVQHLMFGNLEMK